MFFSNVCAFDCVSCEFYWKDSVLKKMQSFIPNYEEFVKSHIQKPFVVIDKDLHILFVIEYDMALRDFIVLRCYPVATGRYKGQKQEEGDLRTPEGVFKIIKVHDSSKWPPYVDLETGEKIGYGPYFLRLKTKWKGIGIHGTDKAHEHEIGTDASHGCIRMKNKDLLDMMKFVGVGTSVVIMP